MNKRDLRVAIKLNAGNDRNGNPRRIFVILDGNGNIVSILDEGHGGDRTIREHYRSIDTAKIPTFDTTPKCYRELLHPTEWPDGPGGEPPVVEDATETYRKALEAIARTPYSLNGHDPVASLAKLAQAALDGETLPPPEPPNYLAMRNREE